VKWSHSSNETIYRNFCYWTLHKKQVNVIKILLTKVRWPVTAMGSKKILSMVQT